MPSHSPILTTIRPAGLMQAAGLVPDPWQTALLESVADRTLLLCSRQAGKSTVASVLALHQAIYRPGSLVLMLAPTLRQSQELFRKCMRCYSAAGRPVRASAETALRLELENGSRIVALPGKEETIRGFSEVSLLLVDEAARVPDELYYAVRPMLAVSSGRMVCLSTPYGRQGWFYREWAEGGEGWRRIRVPASECPRISPQFLEEERRSGGEAWFAQEYCCQFVETEDQYFPDDLIDSLLDPSVKPVALHHLDASVPLQPARPHPPGVLVLPVRRPGKGEPPPEYARRYYLGLDLGQSADHTALALVRRMHPPGWDGSEDYYDRPRDCVYQVVGLKRFPLRTRYPEIARHLSGLLERIAAWPGQEGRMPSLTVDATGLGRPVVDLLREADLDPCAVTLTGGASAGRTGYQEWNVPRVELLSNLQVLLQTRRLRVAAELPEAELLLRELRAFRARRSSAQHSGAPGPAAREREHDDAVFALALACWSGENLVRIIPRFL